MKVCYIDESGNQSAEGSPFFVMVGIVADAQRMSRTKEEFSGILEEVAALFPEALKELKGSKIFNGQDRWRKVEPTTRKEIVRRLCEWIGERKHGLALAAIDRERFTNNVAGVPRELAGDCWLAGAMHIVLQVQRAHQSIPKNKGQTFVIFDENKKKVDALPELLHRPPDWTDSYYDRGKKQEQLDQIVDSAFFVKSHHAGLTQVADVFSFVFRRHAELSDEHGEESFAGEREAIDEYIRLLAPRLLPKAHRWPSKGSACAKWFSDIAPISLLSLK
jgi:hypothetical protein